MLLSEAYHRRLPHSPSPEQAKADIREAMSAGRLRVCAEVYENGGWTKAQSVHPNQLWDFQDWVSNQACFLDKEGYHFFQAIVIDDTDFGACWKLDEGEKPELTSKEPGKKKPPGRRPVINDMVKALIKAVFPKGTDKIPTAKVLRTLNASSQYAKVKKELVS